MSKPPHSPPSSDIDGVNEDEVPNTDVAVGSKQDSGDLKRAGRESVGRPEYSDKQSLDDRSS